jgi:uncharacterized SAM-binding protein YcdF (DUF218 family)
MLPLLTRKERWGLSWRGRLLLAVFVLIMGSRFFFMIGPFLAVTDRADADTLVVEGWMSIYLQRAAAKEFTSGRYHQLFATGGPWSRGPTDENHHKTWAWVGAERLKAVGLSADLVFPVPCPRTSRDRTYESAVALREWRRVHNAQFISINVVTEGVHARRTRLLFGKAFGNEVAVGIVALPSPDYDLAHWWLSSAGVRDVIGETLAYFYAKICFSPG